VTRLVLGAALLASTIALGGCVAGGLAAGPLLAAIQVVGDRSVERTVPADLGAAGAATVDVLSSMAFQLGDLERDGETWSLKAASAGVTVQATLAPVTAHMTRLSLRAEAGGLVADKQTAEQIHQQIARKLAARTGERGAALTDDGRATKATLQALEAQIERLSTAIGRRRDSTQPELPDPKGDRAPTVDPRRIFMVPLSYGVLMPIATGPGAVGAQAPEQRGSFPPDAAALPVAVPSAHPASVPVANANAADAQDQKASVLRPVGGLMPVEATGSEK
jgi:hypothetical protein